ncbi:MAG: TAXI family TRAP transporter solute-binding subunit [Hyphomicrobiaceae bacterium]|nr:TAXI family TRAP transporter solute-binding subunit [Hyphomicrobiaceae bacterium]
MRIVCREAWLGWPAGLLCALFLSITAPTSLAATEAPPPLEVELATATPGGGFEQFGNAAAEAMGAADASLRITTRPSKGSEENIGLLERGEVDFALVAGLPAYEALYGVGRPRADLAIVAALYGSAGLFAVRADSPAQRFRDFVGKPVAWGTPASGLTAIGHYIARGLGLDPDKDFTPRYLEKAGDGPGLVASGAVAGFWGGGIGWPGFTAVTDAGGRLVGLDDEEIAAATAKFPVLKPMVVPAGSYKGQDRDLRSVGAWAYILARRDAPADSVYRLAAALAKAQPALATRLPQAAETTLANTKAASPAPADLHAGVAKLLTERGF